MRYNKIRKMDISNGPGVRVSIFMQGCEFRCKNCFNAETWNFKGGKEFTDETINRVLELSEKDYVAGLSILGGEPMHPKNIDGTIELAREFKKKFPKKTVWVWSGFLYDDSLHNPTLQWKGSSNQRVIDVKKTKKSGKVTLFCD